MTYKSLNSKSLLDLLVVCIKKLQMRWSCNHMSFLRIWSNLLRRLKGNKSEARPELLSLIVHPLQWTILPRQPQNQNLRRRPPSQPWLIKERPSSSPPNPQRAMTLSSSSAFGQTGRCWLLKTQWKRLSTKMSLIREWRKNKNKWCIRKKGNYLSFVEIWPCKQGRRRSNETISFIPAVMFMGKYVT